MAYPTSGRDLRASTINNWLTTDKGPLDCAYAGTPVLDELKKTGKRQGRRGVTQQASAFRILDGGEFIQDAPIINKSDASTNITGDDVIVGRGHDPLERVYWAWCMKGALVQINDFDKVRNQGRAKMVDEWQTRVTERMSRMMYDVNYDIVARDSGTGISSYTGVNGLPWLLDIEGSSDTKAVAGLTRSSAVPGWMNQATKTCGAFATYYYKLSLQRAVAEGACKGGIWNLILTTPTVWNAMLVYLQGKGEVQFQKDDSPDPFYRHFTWFGAKICMDQDLTAGYIYGIPTEDMFFAVHKDHNFKTGESFETPNQFITARKMSFMGNIGFRRFNGAGVTTGWS